MKESSQPSEASNKQQCTVSSLYVSWVIFAIGYPAGLTLFGYEGNWPVFFAWLILLPCAKWAYLRYFPSISKFRGYGKLDDRLPRTVEKSRVGVTFYSLLGCPFCPIVAQRLEALQKEMDFGLTKVDLTLKPQLAASKGIKSVPVVETGKERLVGNATTEQLAKLIAGAQASVPVHAGYRA